MTPTKNERRRLPERRFLERGRTDRMKPLEVDATAVGNGGAGLQPDAALDVDADGARRLVAEPLGRPQR